ncbi:oxygenase MpaB family protein [Antrihabitans stalactiti]|uniref:oxygenase MpaB family protein n=1 Tax=Antrihabitans stalactiti TaxID=2584121 RepID=UPI00146B6B15|nr:oxygenase MpaB family protein [Antrihabitans stalactiti]
MTSTASDPLPSRSEAALPALDSSSLTWKLFGDIRSTPIGLRTATLQAMHPGVGAVLWDSSRFRWELFDRLLRSLPPILGVVYDDPAERTGRTVRDFHKGRVGTDAYGRRWHALGPEVFFWVHATFVESMVATQDHFGTPLTTAEKDQLVAESHAYWNAYGVRAPRELWSDWVDFEAYWNDVLENRLDRNQTTDSVFVDRAAFVVVPTGVPPIVWRLVRRPVRGVSLWLTTGLLPEPARQRLDRDWTRADALMLTVITALVRHSWPVMPTQYRYFPRARAGLGRARSCCR